MEIECWTINGLTKIRLTKDEAKELYSKLSVQLMPQSNGHFIMNDGAQFEITPNSKKD